MKIVKILTLALPIPIYLFLSAVLWNITPDVIVDRDIDEMQVLASPDNDKFLAYSDLEAVYIGGEVMLYTDTKLGVIIYDDTILKTNDGYFRYTTLDGELGFHEVSDLERADQQASKLPLSFFISLMGAGIVFMIVAGKLDLVKSHPNISVLVGLATGTLILYIIDMIVSNILGVFLIATISWAIYMIEDLFQKGSITEAEKNKASNDVIKMLKDAL